MLETERKYLISYGLIALLFLVSTLIIIFSASPYQSGVLLISTFYFSLSCFLVGLLAIVFFLPRIKSQQLLAYEKHRAALREAILLTILVVGSLFLSSRQLLYWWVETVFIAAIVLLEAFFLI